MKTVRRKVVIAAGATWSDSVAMFVLPYIYKTVSAVVPGWPTTFTVSDHSLPEGLVVPIFVANSGALGIDTTPDKPLFVEATDSNTLVSRINTIGRLVTSSLRIAYMTPQDFSGFSAALQFRASVDGPVLAEAAVTLSGSVATCSLTALQTQALLGGGTSQRTGSAQLELTAPDETVSRILQYDWTATPEWTR